MRSTTVLPDNFRVYERIDMQHDKKTALAVTLIGTVLFIALFFLGHFAFYPFSALVSGESSAVYDLLKISALIGLYIVYIILHELTHAAAMKLCGCGKIRFGFTGLYAYAGSLTTYFFKIPYRLIALAPLVVWTLLLTVPLPLAPPDWFWVFYIIQIGNITGCIGDIYVTCRLWKAPADVLVMDTGTEMTVYSAQPKAGG